MITVENLSKQYGPHHAVDNVSFRCEPGTVTGFLGPNGAGKSTTMRMVCGLATPTAGESTVAGMAYGKLPSPGRTVGVLLDASAQHSGRTGREALSISARVLGVGKDRVRELMELVDLSDAAATRRVGNYSLGMRQRLGIAHALLGDPRILILDEPANGLDPEGIYWMRGLLRDFADRGGTVLLSSHLLHEVEAVADRLVVIAGGRIVADGSKAELLAASGMLVRALDNALLQKAFADAGIEYSDGGAGSLVVDAEAEQVGRAIAGSGAILLEMRPAQTGGLEQMFLQLTSGSSTGEEAGR
jgi:ABC-2 type transport system ATP-binding protein